MKQSQSMNIVIVITIFIVILGCAAFFFTKMNNEALMVFPRKTQGVFIEKPHTVEIEGKKFVQWMVPTYCQRNGYEVQTASYQSAANGFWGGRDDAKCVPADGGYQCRGEFLDEMLTQQNEWIVQASNYACPNKASFVSDATKL